MSGPSSPNAICVNAAHWLLPINPTSHAEHLPEDWLTRNDATAVWEAIGRSQPIGRWCLSTGYRQMQPGDVIWAYLSRRQEICAMGRVVAVEEQDGRWYVRVDWNVDATAWLNQNPLPRNVFGQVPMSVTRANPNTVAVLRQLTLPGESP